MKSTQITSNLLFYCYFLCTMLIMASCEKPDQEIEFKDIRNIEVTKVIGEEAFLTADAFFYNPNTQSMKLRSVDLDVMLEGKKIAKVNQEAKVKIPAQSEFSIPLKVKFNIRDAGLLDNLFGLLGGKKFDTHYKGHIKASFRGIPFRVPVDHHEAIKLR